MDTPSINQIVNELKNDTEIERENYLLASKISAYLERVKNNNSDISIDTLLNYIDKLIKKNCDCATKIDSTGESVKYCYCL